MDAFVVRKKIAGQRCWLETIRAVGMDVELSCW